MTDDQPNQIIDPNQDQNDGVPTTDTPSTPKQAPSTPLEQPTPPVLTFDAAVAPGAAGAAAGAAPVVLTVHPSMLERLHDLFTRLEAGALGEVHVLRAEVKALRSHFSV